MIRGRKKGEKKEKRAGAVPLVRLWDATKINKESRPAKGEGDGGVSWRARRREMKVGTLSHSCQQFLMQTLLLIGRASQVLPPKPFQPPPPFLNAAWSVCVMRSPVSGLSSQS